MDFILNNQNYIKLGIIFLVALILLYIIFRKMFKIGSRLKIFSISLITLILVSSITISIMYIIGIDYIHFGNRYYVQGQVAQINNNKMRVRIVEHNLTGYRDTSIIIVTNGETAFRTQNASGFESRILFENISVGDRVNVVCKENNVENNSITAQKILLK